MKVGCGINMKKSTSVHVTFTLYGLMLMHIAVTTNLQAMFLYDMESTSFKSKFLAQINNSFGSGGMSLALNETQFSSFIQFIKTDGLPIKKAALIIGLQNNGAVWVLGKDLHISREGEIIDPVYTWLDDMISEGLYSIRLEEVLPSIKLPLSSSILKR